ncbi:MAG: hypothetical protein LAQ69_33145 [Acidobacteriia bacterium]|nr:hypothetical protein [Terriglobia bacterium]
MIAAIKDCYANFPVDMTELEKQDPDTAFRIWCAMAANRVPEKQACEIRLRAERQAKRLWRTPVTYFERAKSQGPRRFFMPRGEPCQ